MPTTSGVGTFLVWGLLQPSRAGRRREIFFTFFMFLNGALDWSLLHWSPPPYLRHLPSENGKYCFFFYQKL